MGVHVVGASRGALPAPAGHPPGCNAQARAGPSSGRDSALLWRGSLVWVSGGLRGEEYSCLVWATL
jgi:hypothetical protein